MQKRVRGSLKWILDLVLTFIGVALLGQIQSFVVNISNLSVLANYSGLAGVVGLGAIAGAILLFISSIRTRGKGSQKESLKLSTGSALQSDNQDLVTRGLVRQAQLTDVTNSLRVHYRGIIDRMAQWSYSPSDSAESIRLITQTDGQSLIADRSIPANLQNDKMHLKEFDKVWVIYSDGPGLYAAAEEMSKQTDDLVKLKLSESISSLTNSLQGDYLHAFASLIISKADTEYNYGRKSRDFVADMIKVNGVPTPAVDGEPLYNASLANAEKLATKMNEIRSLVDVKTVVGKRREAWNAVLQNKANFLATLQDTVINPARSSNFDDPRLVRGVCDNCKTLTEKRAMLLEA